MAIAEVHAEVAKTKAAMANLKLLVSKLAGKSVNGTRRTNAAVARAGDLRRLDGLYTIYSGSPLTELTSPVYSGPLYEWRCSREDVTRSAMQALARLRRSPEVGVHMNTHFGALNYFAAIWPADLDWPRDIPRPPKSKKEAA